MKYDYDELNRLTNVTMPNKTKTDYTYNNNSQVTSMSGFIKDNISYISNRMSSYTTTSDMNITYSYNNYGLINKIENKVGENTSGFEYSYYSNFNIKTKNDLGSNNHDTYIYDKANRLVEAIMNGNIQSKTWKVPDDIIIKEFDADVNPKANNPFYTPWETEGKMILDSKGKSFVYSINGSWNINKIEFYATNKNHRVRQRDISIYIKNRQEEGWEEIPKSNWKYFKNDENGSIHIEFKTSIQTSYLKIHNDWDDRDLNNISHDNFATFSNTKEKMIRIWTLGDRTEEYEYDNNSNRVGLVVDGKSVSGIEYYKNNMGGNTPMIKFDGEWYYTYDENGNRISKGKSKTEVGSSYVEATETSNGAREGNVVINTSDEYWTYEWDLYNRLVKVKQYNAPDGDSCKEVSYEYDALNFRTKRTSVLEGTVTEYAYGRNGALTYEKFTKNSTVEGSRTYAYLNDQIIGFTDSVGSLSSKRYAVTDIQGSVNEIYDESGNLIWKSGYTAFGELAGESVDKLEGVFEFHGMYTGCQIDGETGLTYHWNRWRSEDGANFITPDPARDGSNWFGYAGQNPVVYVDPIGLFYYTGPTGSSQTSSSTPVTPHEPTGPQGPTGPTETPNVPEVPKQTETVQNNDLNLEHNKVTATPDPDYLITKNRRTILHSLKQKFERAKERNKNFNLKGSNCDKYSTALYDDMDNKPTDWPSPDEYYVGPSKGSKKNYIDYYKNQTKKSPEDGISSVFMDYGRYDGAPHMVTIFKDSDGTISSTEYTLVKGNRKVVNKTYQNQQDFETAYGYSDFYYLSIEVVQ